MFSITYEDEIYRRWSCEYIFNSYKEAERYLINKGFVKNSWLFYRENYNWSVYVKAYINPKKIYNEHGDREDDEC